MNVKQLLSDVTLKLSISEIDNAARDARILVAHALGIPKSQLALNTNENVPEETRSSLEKLISRRINREPIAKILGKRQFWGRTFFINEDVLDPRGDTETLIDYVIDRPVRAVLDLGTGSGVIAISLACEWKEVHVVATDISEAALLVAQKNARYFNVQDKIDFLKSDWFEAIEGKFDLIISNPPYIGLSEINEISQEVLNHDPELALFAGSDGLGAYERIIPQLTKFLNPGGTVVLEIGASQSESVKNLMNSYGLHKVKTLKDLAGKDRLITAKLH